MSQKKWPNPLNRVQFFCSKWDFKFRGVRRIFPGGAQSGGHSDSAGGFKSGFKFRIWVIVLQCSGSGQDPDNFPDPVKNYFDPNPHTHNRLNHIKQNHNRLHPPAALQWAAPSHDHSMLHQNAYL